MRAQRVTGATMPLAAQRRIFERLRRALAEREQLVSSTQALVEVGEWRRYARFRSDLVECGVEGRQRDFRLRELVRQDLRDAQSQGRAPLAVPAAGRGDQRVERPL